MGIAVAQAQDSDSDGWNEAAGVNLSVEEGYGARHSGMAITFGGFHADANAVANAPAAMNDVNDLTFSTSHAEKFGEAKFDDFVVLVPLEARSSLGIGLSRYGVSDIERHREDRSPLLSEPQGLFSVADYLLVAAFSRRFGGGPAAEGSAEGGNGAPGTRRRWTVDAGASFNVLYRQLDQDGFGLRADGMVQGTWDGRFRVGALVKGLIPSAATWESGYNEYEAPDLFLAVAYRTPAPYFYGTLQTAYQTEGLFQKGAKAQGEAYGSRVFGNPGKAVLAGNLGLEFLFDFGLAVRAGLAEMGLDGGTLSSSAFGIGYTWKKMLGLDYSFTPHPDLDASHRISLQFTPAFRNFNGRNFRTGGREPAPPIRHPEDSEPAPTVAPAPASVTSPAVAPATRPEAAPAETGRTAPPADRKQESAGNPPAVQPAHEVLEEDTEENE